MSKKMGRTSSRSVGISFIQPDISRYFHSLVPHRVQPQIEAWWPWGSVVGLFARAYLFGVVAYPWHSPCTTVSLNSRCRTGYSWLP
jgi:hypothetical protein